MLFTPGLQPLGNSGEIVPAGLLNFYEAGTLVRKDTYPSAAGGSANTNPVELDGNGRALIYLDNDGAYDIVFTDADGEVEFWSLESYVSPAPVV